jgi:hypothetical protein
MKEDQSHFVYLFWFIVGLCVFGAVLTIFLILKMPLPVAERIADTAMIFWLSTAVSGGIGYLIGNSASKNKQGPNTDKNE